MLRGLKEQHDCCTNKAVSCTGKGNCSHRLNLLNHQEAESMNERIRVMQRQPRRISITLSYHVHEALLSRSEEEGRSVSNLCAFLLEDALREPNRQIQAPAFGQPVVANGTKNKPVRGLHTY